MPPTTLIDLPPEIHLEILKYVVDSSLNTTSIPSADYDREVYYEVSTYDMGDSDSEPEVNDSADTDNEEDMDDEDSNDHMGDPLAYDSPENEEDIDDEDSIHDMDDPLANDPIGNEGDTDSEYSSSTSSTVDDAQLQATILLESWLNTDRRAFTRPPYNYAAVCQLWFSILKKFPKCWTEVVIDVASDPQRYLDIFLWSKDLPRLTVIIINSLTPDPDDVNHSAVERGRVSAIVNALRPHISRCKTIGFKVAFSTSLPSPVIFLLKDAPDLEVLSLQCEINNAGPPEEYSRVCDLGVHECIRSCASFPALTHLYITGFWFMLLASHPFTSDWYWRIRNNTDSLSVSISRFEFQMEGRYILKDFLGYCSKLGPTKLELRDLSLNSKWGVERSLKSQDCNGVFSGVGPTEEVSFINVSTKVIHSIFLLVEVIECPVVKFKECIFPDIDPDLYWDAPDLILEKIPNSRQTFNRVLENWRGSTLQVVSCPSFDDTTLSIIGKCTDSEWTPQHLRITDCTNFTVPALRGLLERRNQLWVDRVSKERDYDPIEDVVIKGSPSFPSEEDKDWFRTSPYAMPTAIKWFPTRNMWFGTSPGDEAFVKRATARRGDT